MSKGAAQPQEHVCAALRMARAELLQIFFRKMKKKLAFLKKLLYNITCVEESSTGKKNKRD